MKNTTTSNNSDVAPKNNSKALAEQIANPKERIAHTQNSKWIKSLRALPSHPNFNDNLKVEYIDVNLNNSRKLIKNLTILSETSQNKIKTVEDINENLIRLKNVRKELEWLD